MSDESAEDGFLLQSSAANESSSKRLRVRVGTWNVGGVTPGETDLREFIFGRANAPTADILVFSLQELATLDSAINNIVASLVTDDVWTAAIEGYLHTHDYVKLSSIRMCAMQLLVFVRRHHLLHVRHLMTSYTRTGFKGLLGNKGGVSARFSLLGAELAFVGCHLSPHLHNAEERIT